MNPKLQECIQRLAAGEASIRLTRLRYKAYNDKVENGLKRKTEAIMTEDEIRARFQTPKKD